ncbi:ABC transporter ATP-binding protein [Enterococcus asini]|uniref:ABC transporter ATP-binding protein n=1 Tax=Enterococcus asini TaxID=57732 RepID=A0AAW8TTD0_9ENTE|nr:ABC transporter ATP-binding protein [Enterococcus asini]MDT2809390.1 ABC transporter ATP-binding protein [Enterococcus asini]
MNKEIAVSVRNVKKTFKLPTEGSNSLKRTITNYFKGIKGYREQTVLKDINFDVKKGDFFGIVGRNGSGKSTLLKIISQIYLPETGNINIDGKLVSFIELGVGFNPELTGRENVYLNGALLGFSTHEVDEMYNDIVEFAELGEFMNQRLKNYSSGMQVRLAFSVAIQAKSDILVLDEVLAVGDEAFQRKCNDYFMSVKNDKKKTIILVTHSMDAVRKYCNRAMLIDKGEVKVIGSPDEVANQYSLDNVYEVGSATIIEDSGNGAGTEEAKPKEESNKPKSIIENLQVRLLSEKLLSGNDRQVRFDVSYDSVTEKETYVAFSLTDIDRNVWMYNDNSYDFPGKGNSHVSYSYSSSLDGINQCKLRLVVSVRTMDDQMVAIADQINTPTIILSPDEKLSHSDLDSSTGVLTRNGKWMRK